MICPIEDDLQLIVEAVGETKEFVGLFELGRAVRGVPDAHFLFHSIQGGSESVTADNPDGCEFGPDQRTTIVGVGEQQVLLNNIFALDLDVAGEFGQDPDSFPFAKSTGSVINSFV